MRQSKDQGITVLEVVIAITIFMIGITFILQSDAVSHKYFNKGQVRQQMLFYASGVLEATIEGLEVSELQPFSDFVAVVSSEAVAGSNHLELVTVTVTSPSNSKSVELSTYRVNYDE